MRDKRDCKLHHAVFNLRAVHGEDPRPTPRDAPGDSGREWGLGGREVGSRGASEGVVLRWPTAGRVKCWGAGGAAGAVFEPQSQWVTLHLTRRSRGEARTVTFQAQRRPREERTGRRGGQRGGGHCSDGRAPVPVGGPRGTERLAILDQAGEPAWGSGQRQLFSIFFSMIQYFFFLMRIKIYPKNRKCLFKKGLLFF